MEFKKNGISIIMDKNEYESNDLFTSRGWFIINQRPYEIFKNYDEIIKNSKIWINMKFKKCKYDRYTENQIKKMTTYT